MFWYVLHTKQAANQKLLDAINRYKDMQAFIPMVEKWFQGKDIREYQLKRLYPDYIFIKSSLDEKSLEEKYKAFFQAIQGIGVLLGDYHFSALDHQEEYSLSLLFNHNGVIRHSLGRYENEELTVIEGPLQGLENQIIKIDRHKRTALLGNTFLGQKMVLPLEVINRKGSVPL